MIKTSEVVLLIQRVSIYRKTLKYAHLRQGSNYCDLPIGMTLPMSALSLVSWLKNRYKKAEVKVAEITKTDIYLLALFAVLVTVSFYFILKVLNTTNLTVSTISITTSFIAVYLTYKRSPFFALAYAVNDIVLIVLWTVESLTNLSCVPIVSCFATFLVTDLYGFINWLKMKKRQI